MNRSSVYRWSIVPVFLSLAAAPNGRAATYDPAAMFEPGFLSRNNPNGVWSYGTSTSFTGTVSLYTQTSQPGINNVNEQYWSSSPSITATKIKAVKARVFNVSIFLAIQISVEEFSSA